MTTTTIRLSDDLKARVAIAAEHAGVTPHSYMLAAIADKTERDQQRAELEAIAQARYERIAAGGNTLNWQEARRYIRERAAGHHPARPAGRKPNT